MFGWGIGGTKRAAIPQENWIRITRNEFNRSGLPLNGGSLEKTGRCHASHCAQ